MTSEKKQRSAERARERALAKPLVERPTIRTSYDPHKLFPRGYPIGVLEGYRIPTNNEIKRVMAQRCAYLIETVERRARLGQPADFALVEIAAIARLIDLLDASRS
jgi:hypothetical protein